MLAFRYNWLHSSRTWHSVSSLHACQTVPCPFKRCILLWFLPLSFCISLSLSISVPSLSPPTFFYLNKIPHLCSVWMATWQHGISVCHRHFFGPTLCQGACPAKSLQFIRLLPASNCCLLPSFGSLHSADTIITSPHGEDFQVNFRSRVSGPWVWSIWCLHLLILKAQ